jgi:glycosyltransferase involved in cell wall biosynthesis
MNLPGVDVLIALHRNDRFLAEAITSIMKSVDVCPRIILIDDRVDDSTELPYQNLCEVVKTSGGLGFEKAINLGSQKIESEYVAILGSDDLSSPMRLRKQIQKLEETESNLSLCRIKKFQIDKNIPNLGGGLLGNQYQIKVLLISSIGADGTWVAKSSWWLKNIKFQESDSDWAFALRNFEKYQICFSKDVFVRYRMHKLQITRNLTEGQKLLKISYIPWAIQCEINNLTILDFENFLILNGVKRPGPKELENREYEKWLCQFWKILSIKEKLALRQVFGRRLVMISVLSRSKFKESKLNLLAFIAIPSLALDVVKVLWLKIRRYNIEIRPRIRLDP